MSGVLGVFDLVLAGQPHEVSGNIFAIGWLPVLLFDFPEPEQFSRNDAFQWALVESQLTVPPGDVAPRRSIAGICDNICKSKV